MRADDFNYDLPPDLIAQYPPATRGSSRLLVLNRSKKTIKHRNFPDLGEYLDSGDLLVLNNSKVIPARLRAIKPQTGGSIEVLLLEEIGFNEWWAMVKPGKRVRRGTVVHFSTKTGKTTDITAEVQEKSDEGHYRLRFRGEVDVKDHLNDLGEIPLPPYIQRPSGPDSADWERYQTVFAKPPGSVAAPTAGLHFTPLLLESIRAMGVAITEVTLHVGLGTFAPVKSETVATHTMHEERYEVPANAAQAIAQTKARGGRVIAVGTTSLRVLESVAATAGTIVPGPGKTRMFAYPPYKFQMVDGLLTNFHLPKSTLLMLVSAFASPGTTDGVALIRNAYEEAVRELYRFFSYGDAMLIL